MAKKQNNSAKLTAAESWARSNREAASRNRKKDQIALKRMRRDQDAWERAKSKRGM